MPISGAMPFRPAHVEGGGTPATRHYVVKSGEDFVMGAPMTMNAGEVDEIDTDDVTLILGVAASADASAFGYDAADSPTVITGRADTVPVFTANRNTVFYGQLSNGTTALVDPAAANCRTYGIVKQTDGVWTVDTADTTNLVVNVVGYTPAGASAAGSAGYVHFKFIGSTLYGA